jgi:molybdopterin-containing oxidoreductase family iron-sulfur binding subunit
VPELDRRDFLKVVGMGAGAAATAACQEPVERVIPYLVQPEEILPGIATYYASTCRECPNSCAAIVKTREGRPIKVDGNPEDPISRGKLCARGQAGLRRTYDPRRFTGPMRRDGDGLVPTTWDEGIALLVEKLRPAAPAGKVVFLGGSQSGTLDELIDGFLAGLGSPNRVQFELYAHEALRWANAKLFGTDAVPSFDLEKADVLVAFGTDFMETWLNPVQNQAGFSASRVGGKGYAIFVGPRLGVSAANGDEWIAATPGTEILVALALAHEVARIRGIAPAPLTSLLEPYRPASVAERTGVPAERLERVAARIAKARAPLALPPGNELQGTNAGAFAAAVQILNVASGALGRTVRFGPDHNVTRLARFAEMKELAGRMRGGEIAVLMVHESNPVYAVPGAFGFEDALKQVPFVVSFSSANDETTAHADLVLPTNTPFEAWGDAQPVRGVRRLQQPTIRPIYDTRELGDVLLEVGGALGVEAPAPSFKELLAAQWGGRAGLEGAAAAGGEFLPAPAQPVVLSPDLGGLQFEPAQLGGQGALVLVAYPSLSFYDGRSARLNVLQELPNPVTKVVWQSVAELHTETAAELGIALGDVVRVTTESGSVELPAMPHDAIRKGVVAIEVGQGHQPLEPDMDLNQRWGQYDWLALTKTRGVNVLRILPGRLDANSGGLSWLQARVDVEKTGATEYVTKTQPTFDQEHRGFARATTLAALAGTEEPPHDFPHMEVKDYDPARDSHKESPYRWGMSIDLDACTGCNACTVGCSEENNVPTVGPEMVRRGREMHWIRIARFVEHHDGDLDVRHLPMLCQQCGAAPCENVCPVLATYHTDEGLNAMIPNRCIGTRYCSNNCPYKARRFNYLPYDFEVREPEHLKLNPDVTVRTKGVMEKCTFCVQRIMEARDEAVREKRVVRDGEITPACAQTCPSNAIVFGNYKDPSSRVSELWKDERRYVALDHLYTRPAVGYLKQIRRNDSHEA